MKSCFCCCFIFIYSTFTGSLLVVAADCLFDHLPSNLSIAKFSEFGGRLLHKGVSCERDRSNGLIATSIGSPLCGLLWAGL